MRERQSNFIRGGPHRQALPMVMVKDVVAARRSIPGKYLMEEIVREFLKYWGKLRRYEPRKRRGGGGVDILSLRIDDV